MDATLARAPTSELRRLLRAIERSAVSTPLREAELRAEGLPAAELIAVLGDLERAPLERVIGAFIADREQRPPPHLDLVWTGPETRVATSRDTAVLVRELLADARESVLIAGFAFDHGEEVFAPLHEAMRTRGVKTEIYLDIRDAAPAGADAGDHARGYLTAFLGKNWSFGPPFPTLYYDPRSAEYRATASLHAKCLVVDLAKTLITSANFTDRGQTRNIELGVLIEDRDFAARVVAQWRSLVEAGHLVTVPW
jgi:phosphatidylserine/phosphatidylglycerophosphate/cardiolipin synthase-like enzyme